MALFSDLDWIILLGVGAFLLLGKENAAVLRQFGRYYGRIARLKAELVADLHRAADLPPPVPGQPATLRSTLMQFAEPAPVRVAHVPIAVTVAPRAPLVSVGILTGANGSGVGPETWSVARADAGLSDGGRR
ncbi:MAG TPA: hypothetical protein VMH78_04895 [Thermoplasmata archaeon]|nr:hypothetical protein [Thermoplasmata archaeon]